MLTADSPRTRPLSARWLRGGLLAAVLLVGACSGGGSTGAAGESTDGPSGPNRGPLPTIDGGVELAKVDPAALLVAQGLAFGQPLPSERVAAEAFADNPEVTSALARRVFGVGTKRLIANLVVLTLDGSELFDAGVTDAFVAGVIESFGGGRVQEVPVAKQMTLRSVGDTTAAQGFRVGNQLVVATAPTAEDAALVVNRQLAARAKGASGSLDPVTPMLPLPIGAPFVAVPTVTFRAIPPAEEELPPEVPTMAGATGVEGRYGVVAGERRTVVWSFTVDPATYPSAERLEPAMLALAAARSGGSPAKLTEVIDRVVATADRAPGVEGALATRVFRHGALVVLVEGADPVQVEAVVADWISTLAR